MASAGVARLRARAGPLPSDIPYMQFALDGWRRNPQKTAVVDVLHEQKLTFGELEERVFRLAGRLQKLGVGSQVKVQFHADNSLPTLIALQAALFCNATVVLFSPDKTLKYDEFKFQTEDSDVQCIIVDVHNYEFLVHSYLDDPSCTVKQVIIVDGRSKLCHSKTVTIDDVPDAGRFVEPTVRVRDDVLLMLYTSGSTGRPKGVLHGHISYMASQMSMQQLGWFGEHDQFLLMNSLTYVSGVIFHAAPLACGSTLLLASNDIEHDFPRYCRRYKPTVTMLIEIPARNIVASVDRYPDGREALSSLRLILIAGTVFPETLRKSIVDLFTESKFVNGYGMTESMGALVVSDPLPYLAVDAGYAVPNTTLRVVDKVGAPVNVGETGEILFDGIQKMFGYWKQTNDSFTDDNFFRTGDLGFIDDDGNLTLMGRNKHFIICLDSRVSPLEIEEALLEHPNVAEAVVVGVPHPQYQEAPAALVVVRNKSALTPTLASELTHFIENKFAEYKQLHGGVFFADELQRTTSGKYARSAIAKTVLRLVKESQGSPM